MNWKIVLLSVCLMNSAIAENSLKNRVRIEKTSTLKANTWRGSADYNTEKAQIIARRRATLVNDLKKVLRESKDSDQRRELQFRLANLYLEEYKFQNAQNHGGRSFLEKSYSLYKELAQQNPRATRQDEVFFQLAQTASEMGNNAEALTAFETIAQQYPQSPFFEEAHLQLGENAFETSNFKKAEHHFDVILKNRESSLVLYAHYKKAWCAFNDGRIEESLRHFKTIITEEEVGSDRARALALKKEALRDICLSFVELNRIDEAKAFFRDQDEATYRRSLESLAVLALEKGKFDQTVSLNKSLLELDSHFVKNPQYSLSIVEAYRSKGERKQALRELENALDSYLGNSTWREIFSADIKALNDIKEALEDLTKKMAFEIHSDAQKTKNPELYKVSRSFYENYLRFFSEATDATKIRFYLAEILFHQQEYELASKTYFDVFDSPTASKELRSNSLKYALMASSAQIGQARKQSGLSDFSPASHSKLTVGGAESVEALPFSETERFFLKSGNLYLKDFPKTPEASGILFQCAYLNYLHYEYADAYKLFWQVVQDYPDQAQSKQSAVLILDILNRKNDYKNMVTAVKRFLKTPFFNDARFQSEISDILRKSELKEIAQLESDSRMEEAGKAYLKYVKTHGAEDAVLAEKALYNAGVCFSKAGLSKEALESQEQFLTKFPKSPFRENLMLGIAKHYEALTEFEKAGQFFEMFSREFSTHAKAKESLRLAGIYYWGAGQTEKAEKAFLSYLNSYAKDKSGVSEDLLDFYLTQDQTEKQISFLLKARSEKGISISDYLDYTLRLEEAQKRLYGKSQAVLGEEAQTTVDRFSKALSETPRGIQLMAKVLLRRAESRERAFEAIRLNNSQQQVETLLAKKLRMLKELEVEFGKIAALGGEEGLAAIYKTANAYAGLSAEISEAPVPSELTAAQLDLYRQELNSKMVSPFKEKAKSITQQCLEKASQHRVLSTWKLQCQSLARQLDPQRYPLTVTYSLPSFQTSFISSGEDSTVPNSFYQSASFFKEALKDRGVASIDYGPKLLSFQLLSNEREEALKLNESEYSAEEEKVRIAELNQLRIKNPQQAYRTIRGLLKKESKNPALHNLLALAAMEQGQYDMAKTIWLSLIARGVSSPAIQNNLGVLESIRGHVPAALSYFTEARKSELAEASINLGLIALRFHQGELARLYFEESQDSGNLLAKIGMGVALIQVGDLEQAKSSLESLQKKHPDNPWLHYSLKEIKEAGPLEMTQSEESEPERRISSKAPSTYTEGVSLPELE